MKRTTVDSVQYIAAVLLAMCSAMTVLGDPAGKTAPKAHGGVFVESVESGGAAEKAGLKPGDLIVSWERVPAPPNSTESSAGNIEFVFDWNLMLLEQAPRALVVLTVAGERHAREASLHAGEWGLAVRPPMAAPVLKKYEKAQAQMDSGDKEKGLEALESLAESLAKGATWDLACWFYLKAGKRWEKEGGWAEAREDHSKALEAARGKRVIQAACEAWTGIGNACRGMGDYEKAGEAFGAATRLRAGDSGESLALAESLSCEGMLAERPARFGSCASLL